MMRSKIKDKANKNLSKSTSRNGKKKTCPKVYGAPKRPLSGYSYFLKERLKSFYMENPKNTNNRGKNPILVIKVSKRSFYEAKIYKYYFRAFWRRKWPDAGVP